MDASPTDPGPVAMLNVHLSRLFFVILFLAAFCAGSSAQNVDKLIAAGDALRKQFDTYGAYESYYAAYAMDSTNIDVLCRLSQELIELGNEYPKSADQKSRYNEALHYARKAIENTVDSSNVYAVLGHALEKAALYESGKVKIKLLNELHRTALAGVKNDSINDRCFALLGRWHWTMMSINWLVKGYSKLTDGSLPEEPSYEKAEEYFLKAIALNGEQVGHFMELGKTYVRLEKWHDAQLAFEEAAFLPNRTKKDSRWKRDTRKYLSMLEAGEYAPLKDAVEE